MVKTMRGLAQGPRAPALFGETRRYSGPLQRGDEVRCRRADQEIYVEVFGVSPDGWLLGHVLTLGASSGLNGSETRIADLVEFRADRVLAVFRPDDLAA